MTDNDSFRALWGNFFCAEKRTKKDWLYMVVVITLLKIIRRLYTVVPTKKTVSLEIYNIYIKMYFYQDK